MIRICKKDAVEMIQGVVVSLGGIPLPVTDAGVIVITPAQFAKCIEAAREGAAEAVREELELHRQHFN